MSPLVAPRPARDSAVPLAAAPAAALASLVLVSVALSPGDQLERVGGVAGHDVTVPSRSASADYVSMRDLSGDLATDGSDSRPEGLAFVTAQDPPSKAPLLMVADDVSGTTTVHEVTGP